MSETVSRNRAERNDARQWAATSGGPGVNVMRHTTPIYIPGPAGTPRLGGSYRHIRRELAKKLNRMMRAERREQARVDVRLSA